MFINLEPGYHVLYFPLDCFRPHKDWLFPVSWILGIINPFPRPTYVNQMRRDCTVPEDTEVVICWNRLRTPKFWKFCEIKQEVL
jgi:hypothetical protein